MPRVQKNSSPPPHHPHTAHHQRGQRQRPGVLHCLPLVLHRGLIARHGLHRWCAERRRVRGLVGGSLGPRGGSGWRASVGNRARGAALSLVTQALGASTRAREAATAAVRAARAWCARCVACGEFASATLCVGRAPQRAFAPVAWRCAPGARRGGTPQTRAVDSKTAPAASDLCRLGPSLRAAPQGGRRAARTLVVACF